MPPKSESRTLWLVEQLREEVREKRLAEGDFFATEAELCTRYGLSRTIVREAVGRLRALGLLVSRQKKGLLVGRGNPLRSLSSVLPFFGRASEENRHQLAQLRYALEIGAVDLAIENGTPEQVAELEKTAEAFACAVSAEERAACIHLDARFHALLLEMTANALIAGMHRILDSYFATLAADLSTLAPDLSESSWQHRAIAQAFGRRDFELARMTLRNHLKPLLRPDATKATGNAEDRKLA